MLSVKTALVRSARWSAELGAEVFYKMDALQPPGSFKVRGIGRVVSNAAKAGAKGVVSSSGGNAGLATAYCAQKLGLECVVVLPTTTPATVLRRLEFEYGARVVSEGAVWDVANLEAQRIAKERGWPLVHPFQGAEMWRGHATVVEEIVEQLGELNLKPDCIVAAVGGGGLLMGVLEGLKICGMEDVLVVAAETRGAHSFAHSLDAKEARPLPGGITSVAKSLGAVTPSAEVVAAALASNVASVVVDDKQALRACIDFAAETRILVEPACGAALAVLIDAHRPSLAGRKVIVVEVCGGAVVDVPSLLKMCADTGLELDGPTDKQQR